MKEQKNKTEKYYVDNKGLGSGIWQTFLQVRGVRVSGIEIITCG